jgi:hypothetical protein
MIVRLISPFATTYSKLSLQNKWWHRLSIVGLVFCVVAAFALSLALTLGPDIQSHRAAAPAKREHGPWEQYAQITNLPPLPKGYSALVMLSGQGERIQFPTDTTKSELIKAICEHLKQGDAACWRLFPKPRRHHRQHRQSSYSRTRFPRLRQPVTEAPQKHHRLFGDRLPVISVSP